MLNGVPAWGTGGGASAERLIAARGVERNKAAVDRRVHGYLVYLLLSFPRDDLTGAR